MSIRAVLFDAVGTLIHPDPPVARAYHAVAGRLGARLTETEIELRFQAAMRAQDWSGPTSEATERRRWRNVVRGVFSDFRGDAKRLFEDLWDHFGDGAQWRVYPDVNDAWRELEERDLLVGIASNFDQRLQRIQRQLTPLCRAGAVFCSSQLGHGKPSSEFFREARNRLGLTAETILMVGDDWRNDVAGARAAGWRAIHLDRNGTRPTAHSIRGLGELSHYLERMADD